MLQGVSQYSFLDAMHTAYISVANPSLICVPFISTTGLSEGKILRISDPKLKKT
jgi:hypothetical protein